MLNNTNETMGIKEEKMYKIIIGLDQFKHAFNNGFIDNTVVFLYTNAIDRDEPSKLVLRAIDKGFNGSEIIALIDLLSLKRHRCIRDLDIFCGSENNYGSFTRDSFIQAQKKAGRYEDTANECFDIIERVTRNDK